MEERPNRKGRHKKIERQCFSMDESILEKLQEKLTQNRSKVDSINKSMNSLPTVSNQELLNFLCNQNVKAQTSELCKIAREINLSQLEDFSLDPAEKLRVIEGCKYHSWPKHSRQNYKEHKVIRYHNYGLKEEQEPPLSTNGDSCEDLLDTGKGGFSTERSWTSPSELNVVPEECSTELSNLFNKKHSVSCPCLASSLDDEKQLNTFVQSYLSLRNLTKSGESLENITENIEGIINNDFKKKFKSSSIQRTSKTNNTTDTNASSKEFDKAYNSVFKHNNILDLIQDNCETSNTLNKRSKHYRQKSCSSSPLLSSPAKHSHFLISENGRAERTSSYYNDDSSDSDSGVGQFQDLLPYLRFAINDVGVQPQIFKEKADVST